MCYFCRIVALFISGKVEAINVGGGD